MPAAATITPLDLLTRTSFQVVPAVLIAATLGWYLWAVRRLAARGRRWPLARTVSYCVAELFLAVATFSGLAAYDDSNFTMHAVQHILLMMLAPIFVALAAPVTLALQSSHRRVQTALIKVLHSRVAVVLSSPLVTWPLYGATIFGYYFTSLYADSLRDPVLHDLIHLHMVVVGCLFVWPVIGIDPLPRRMSYGFRMLFLLLTMPFHTILGMALMSQSTRIAPGIGLTDLHTGGALLWVSGEFLGLLGTMAVFGQWLRTEERAAKRNDRLGDAAAAAQLEHWRATREAAAKAGTVLQA